MKIVIDIQFCEIMKK